MRSIFNVMEQTKLNKVLIFYDVKEKNVIPRSREHGSV